MKILPLRESTFESKEKKEMRLSKVQCNYYAMNQKFEYWAKHFFCQLPEMYFYKIILIGNYESLNS